MKIEYEILVNQYGQKVIDIESIALKFNKLESKAKKDFLTDLINLIQQSKAEDDDITQAIIESKLKPTFTPCIMLMKGGSKVQILLKLIHLPDTEIVKVFFLLMNLFRVAYYRRFIIEKGNSNKWWYWDLSDKKNVLSVLNKYSQGSDCGKICC